MTTENPHLMTFLMSTMKMSSNYQPLIIRELLENGGRVEAEQLAMTLVLHNNVERRRALDRLNGDPWDTLGKKHGVVRREGRGKGAVWILTAEYDLQELATLLKICKQKIKEGTRPKVRASASTRFQLIQESEGRCQACGILSQDEDLHIDHIVPKKGKDSNNKVRTAGGKIVDVDSKENLQVLCATCNTGKREHGNFDFRPTPDRLNAALVATLRLAKKYGYDIQFSAGSILVHYPANSGPILPSPASSSGEPANAQRTD